MVAPPPRLESFLAPIPASSPTDAQLQSALPWGASRSPCSWCAAPEGPAPLWVGRSRSKTTIHGRGRGQMGASAPGATWEETLASVSTPGHERWPAVRWPEPGPAPGSRLWHWPPLPGHRLSAVGQQPKGNVPLGRQVSSPSMLTVSPLLPQLVSAGQ